MQIEATEAQSRQFTHGVRGSIETSLTPVKQWDYSNKSLRFACPLVGTGLSRVLTDMPVFLAKSDRSHSPMIISGLGVCTLGLSVHKCAHCTLKCGRKLPNRLPNFRLISCLISCLIVCSSLNRNLGFIFIGDALRDHPATPEMGTFVPNGRRHGPMAAAAGPARKRKSN